jgi:hypothetical protein
LNPHHFMITGNLLNLCSAECSKYNGCSGSLHLITPKTSRIQLGPDGGTSGTTLTSVVNLNGNLLAPG